LLLEPVHLGEEQCGLELAQSVIRAEREFLLLRVLGPSAVDDRVGQASQVVVVREERPALATGMIAFVLGVTAASTCRGSIVQVSLVTSTMTGSAPATIGAQAVAANVSAGTMTSSPHPIPRAFKATSIVTVPLAMRTPCFAP
jgi:hypothetical protein